MSRISTLGLYGSSNTAGSRLMMYAGVEVWCMWELRRWRKVVLPEPAIPVGKKKAERSGKKRLLNLI